ncbi:hypothetical protein P168DRAFT_327777 [Aspergillus campestris IBT 28561]|uniref:Uncharacterized protein n=1 Tax=Aspergillus campestris (strain IBT 28561) TaxID=1392248 RepID=A0A2I1D1I1_ASPC2|nr:uncharacterized protein P168DRAFT_327777 [Aspergillus campestris IBT 28561]PKY03734.1 hypothetical protein P168DRAFT_327777 [Aspergillus campestris IBT 28561]
MSRTIYLAVFSNGPKPAHQAVFIPTGDAATGKKGNIIHVTGNPATGFFLEFKRNYDFEFEDRKYQVVTLVQVNAQYIRDTVGNGEPSTDTIARDRLESVATVVSPPGPSPNPFGSLALNCQNWMRDYVERLVVEGLVPSSAGLIMESAPRLL